MTRSISFSRPMTGSSWLARAASVRLMPSWSRVGVLLGRFVSCVGDDGGRLAQDVDHLVADLVEVHAQALEHAGRNPLAFADEAQEEVLGADVVVAQASRLVDGQLDHALGAWGQPDLTDDRAVATADDELHRGTHLGELDVHVLEHACRHALALADETEEEVLGADVVVVEALRLVLRQGQDLARPIGELVESVHGRGHPCDRDRQHVPCVRSLVESVRHHSGAVPSIGTTVQDAQMLTPERQRRTRGSASWSRGGRRCRLALA